MRWINDYQLFLFDFDGLLVNTEQIHFQAYQSMCEKYGFKLDWTFERYCLAAHYKAEGLREQIYACLPQLYDKEPHWDVLYAYKKEKVIDLLQSGLVQLMPGVERFLDILKQKQAKCCVVTHSPNALVSVLRKQIPILNTIPYWITREDYTYPKPSPEGYQMAINQFSSPHDKIIGFEDTPRGIEALLQTRATPILISSVLYQNIPKQVECHTSFETGLDLKNPFFK